MSYIESYINLGNYIKHINSQLIRSILLEKLDLLSPCFGEISSEDEIYPVITKLDNLGYVEKLIFTNPDIGRLIIAYHPELKDIAFYITSDSNDGTINIKFSNMIKPGTSFESLIVDVLIYHVFCNVDLFYIDRKDLNLTDLELFKGWMNLYASQAFDYPIRTRVTETYRSFTISYFNNNANSRRKYKILFNKETGALMSLSSSLSINGKLINDEVFYDSSEKYQSAKSDVILNHLYQAVINSQ